MLINQVSKCARLTAAMSLCLTPAGTCSDPTGLGHQRLFLWLHCVTCQLTSCPRSHLLQDPFPGSWWNRDPSVPDTSWAPFLMDLFSSLLRCGTQYRTTLPAGGSFTPCRPQNRCLLSPMAPLLYWVFTMWQAGWWFWCYGYMKSLTLCRDGKVKLREVVLDAWGYTAR